MTSERKIEEYLLEHREIGCIPGSETTNQNYLINKINYINFNDQTIRIVFKHKRFGRVQTFEAKPQPCSQEILHCLWIDSLIQEIDLERYTFQYLIISDDKELIFAEPMVIDIDQQQIALLLPEKCLRFMSSKGSSLPCKGVEVTFCQNSSVFSGEILKFSPFSLEIKINFSPPQTPHWINPEDTAIVILHENGTTYYSGECKIFNLQENKTEQEWIYELEPLQNQVPRFSVKEFRNIRQELNPSPDIVFIHPLTKKKMILKAKDISGSGLCVVEEVANAQLLPGMIIPEVEISFANTLKLKCCIQVVYCNRLENDQCKNSQKCGMAFLDMDMEDHLKLLSICQQAIDKNSYICNEVSMEELWNFFFETGFIYPEKYRQMQSNKGNLKELYEKLYTQNPHIARHFIYQENGRILGHMAMVRLYNNSWMIHHHAANRERSHWAGIKVLSQLIRYANNVHNLRSAHMRYVFSYFRPENKFPRKVLGGLVEHFNNAKKCSLDTFAYVLLYKRKIGNIHLPKNWRLEKATKNDLVELSYFYDDISHGLFLEAFEMQSPDDLCQDLIQEYHKMGFKKEKLVFSLKENNSLKAVYILNISDITMNMSDLTNCLKVIVIDDLNLKQEIFLSTFCYFFPYFDMSYFPVLIYPTEFTNKMNINIDKYYKLWILDLNYIDQYIKFYKRILRNI